MFCSCKSLSVNSRAVGSFVILSLYIDRYLLLWTVIVQSVNITVCPLGSFSSMENGEPEKEYLEERFKNENYMRQNNFYILMVRFILQRKKTNLICRLFLDSRLNTFSCWITEQQCPAHFYATMMAVFFGRERMKLETWKKMFSFLKKKWFSNSGKQAPWIFKIIINAALP